MIDRRWRILGVLFLARTAMGFQFQSVASTTPLLIADLHIGYATIGTLIGLYMLPGILIAFPGGLLSRRFGDKAVCVAGLALMMLGGGPARHRPCSSFGVRRPTGQRHRGGAVQPRADQDGDRLVRRS